MYLLIEPICSSKQIFSFEKQGYEFNQIANTYKIFPIGCKVQDLVKTVRSLLAKIKCFNDIFIQVCSKIPFSKNLCHIKNGGIICIVNHQSGFYMTQSSSESNFQTDIFKQHFLLSILKIN